MMVPVKRTHQKLQGEYRWYLPVAIQCIEKWSCQNGYWCKCTHHKQACTPRRTLGLYFK